MGISASCQPTYPRHNDFVQLVKNANNFISRDVCIWTPNEKILLGEFFENLQIALYNTQDCNSQLPWYNPGVDWHEDERFKDYFTRVRLAVPRSVKIRKIFSYTLPPKNEDFMFLNSKSRTQLASFYAVIAFLWSMYNDGGNAVKYFYKSDILYHVYNNCQSVDIMISAIEKIYFTNKNGFVPANNLVMPTCSFRLLEGRIKTFLGETVINGPRTYNVIPQPEIINEPFYTLTPCRINVLFTSLPNVESKINSDAIDLDESMEDIGETSLQQIHRDINSLLDQIQDNENEGDYLEEKEAQLKIAEKMCKAKHAK